MPISALKIVIQSTFTLTQNYYFKPLYAHRKSLSGISLCAPNIVIQNVSYYKETYNRITLISMERAEVKQQ